MHSSLNHASILLLFSHEVLSYQAVQGTPPPTLMTYCAGYNSLFFGFTAMQDVKIQVSPLKRKNYTSPGFMVPTMESHNFSQ